MRIYPLSAGIRPLSRRHSCMPRHQRLWNALLHRGPRRTRAWVPRIPDDDAMQQTTPDLVPGTQNIARALDMIGPKIGRGYPAFRNPPTPTPTVD